MTTLFNKNIPNKDITTENLKSTNKQFKRKPFFYDAQLKRYYIQLMSLFSGYQVITGTQRDGKHRLIDCPVIFGDTNRVGSYILNAGSDNTMAHLPVISITIKTLDRKQDWVQNPTHTERYNFIERRKDPNGKFLIGVPGQKKTVERYMPVPYVLAFKVSIWTPNNDQGYQLVEQIATAFNPRLDILLSNSPADWSALSTVLFEGNIDMEKEVPSGTEIDPLHVFSMDMSTEIYLSIPSKVYETKYIYSIHVPIRDFEYDLEIDEMMELDKLVIKATEHEILLYEQATIV